jgi:hypothetical protein
VQWRGGAGNAFSQLKLQRRKGSADTLKDETALCLRRIGDDPRDQLKLLYRPVREQFGPVEQEISGDQDMDQDQRYQDEGGDLATDPPEAEQGDNVGGSAHASSTIGVKM